MTLALLAAALMAAADEGWDAREARGVRQTVYPAIEHLQDFAQIKDAFEKGLSGDKSVVPTLTAFVQHPNEDVASTAAQMLGRFSKPRCLRGTAIQLRHGPQNPGASGRTGWSRTHERPRDGCSGNYCSLQR